MREVLVLPQEPALMQVEWSPFCLWQRPFLRMLPLICSHHIGADRRLLHDPGLDPLEPMVEPTERLVLELIDRAFEIGRRRHDHLLRTPHPLPAAERAGQVKTIDAPVTANIG